MEIVIEVEEVSAMRIAAVHHVGPYERIGEAFARLHQLARAASLPKPPISKLVAIYDDDPATNDAASLRADAGIALPPDVAVPDGLVERRIAAGRYATTTHAGSYEGLGDAWRKFRDEVAARHGGHRSAGPTFEIYRNTPEDTAPADLRTTLFIPIDG